MNRSHETRAERTPRLTAATLSKYALSVGLVSWGLVTASGAPAAATLRVQLPAELRPFPEPLPPGKSQPGFKFRGTKGWGWTPEQYLEEVPTLASDKMNFLMNCYGSLFTGERGSRRNEWWKPLPAATKAGFAKVIRACRDNGIIFCFAVHPQLRSPRPLNPESAEDLENFYQHYAWAQGQGVHWFSISLDDVNWGHRGPAAGGAEHAKLVNTVLERLRQKDAGAQMIFCPVPYWGDGTKPDHRAYLEALGRDLQPDVYVFWTGDAETTSHITRRAAESYKGIVKHRLFLWDNYPVNDHYPTLHLGPVSGREPDLCEVIDGYMSNPMATQNQINRIPLATCADYAYNPWSYDPNRSIGQAILRMCEPAPHPFLPSPHSLGQSLPAPGSSKAQCQVLKELVEAYPGFIVITGGRTSTNPVRKRFDTLIAEEGSHAAALELCHHIEDIEARLGKEFPQQFVAARKTVADDVAWMKQNLRSNDSDGKQVATPDGRAQAADAPGLKVAVFADPDGGSTASDCVAATTGILRTNGFQVAKISPAAIRAGGLKDYAVVMFPGGGGTTQAKSLQQAGCAQVERFVARGGGYIGTCAGAFLAARGYNKETSWLEIVNARVIDLAHWDRGTGQARIHILNPKHPILAGFPEDLWVHYFNGPLLGPGASTNPPPYEAEAVFASDIHDHAPAGIMPGTTCVTTSTYQSGRCVLFSFHPELTPELQLMTVRAVKWAAGKP